MMPILITYYSNKEYPIHMKMVIKDICGEMVIIIIILKRMRKCLLTVISMTSFRVVKTGPKSMNE